MDLQSIIDYALAPHELQQLWNNHKQGTIPIIDYNQIIDADSLDSIFDGNNGIIIFYPNSEEKDGSIYGHYVSAVKKGKKFYFCDSYGEKPDVGQKPQIGRSKFYDEENNSLIRHLIEGGYKVDYSPYKLQADNDTTQTCGRHSLMRCYYSNLTNDQYYKKIKQLVNKFKLNNPDELVSIAFS